MGQINYISCIKTLFSYKMKRASKPSKVVVDKEDEKENSHPNETPMGPPSSPVVPPSQSHVFLGKKADGKQEYQLNDAIHTERSFYGDTRARLLSNERGMFLDLRKYSWGKPTKRGVRLPIDDFIQLAEWGLKAAKDYRECDK